MDKKQCILCHEYYDVQSGHFTRHLKMVHNLSLEEYVIITEYDGIAPKCACGYCNELPVFYRGAYKKYAQRHDEFEYLKRKYIEKNGIPKCPTCGSDITKWHRGKPLMYCSLKCRPGNWNNEKIRKTVHDKYGVDNVRKLHFVQEKIQSHITKESYIKASNTKKIKYKNKAFDVVKHQEAIFKKYGVTHPSKILKNRKKSSSRMKHNNPMFNSNTVNKVTNTKIEKYKNGTLHIKTKTYDNTSLTYQSSYELDFLNLCKTLDILNLVKNGNVYRYTDTDGYCITDFCIGNFEIEIKSTYILKIQGGIEIINMKKNAVESTNKKYVLILDKKYTEFLSLLQKIKSEVKPTHVRAV